METCFTSQRVDLLFPFWCNATELLVFCYSLPVCFHNLKHCKIYKQYVKLYMDSLNNKIKEHLLNHYLCQETEHRWYPRSSLCDSVGLRTHSCPQPPDSIGLRTHSCPHPPDDHCPEFCVNHTLTFYCVCVCIAIMGLYQEIVYLALPAF